MDMTKQQNETPNEPSDDEIEVFLPEPGQPLFVRDDSWWASPVNEHKGRARSRALRATTVTLQPTRRGPAQPGGSPCWPTREAHRVYTDARFKARRVYVKSKTGKHARNIQIPEEWLGLIGEALKQPDAPDSVSAWIRSAMKEKLDRVQTAKEMREIEERQAATLTQILDILRRVDRAVQTHLALQDAINPTFAARVEFLRKTAMRRAEVVWNQ
jgi:hypothetical protein